MNYNEIPNEHVAIMVARRWFDDVIQYGVNEDGSVYLDRASVDELVDFDPCNNFDDAWPIMQHCGMSLDVNGTASIPKSVSALNYVISHRCEKALLRAAMLCYLELKDNELK